MDCSYMNQQRHCQRCSQMIPTSKTAMDCSCGAPPTMIPDRPAMPACPMRPVAPVTSPCPPARPQIQPDRGCISQNPQCSDMIRPDTRCSNMKRPDTNCSDMICPDTRCSDMRCPNTSIGCMEMYPVAMGYVPWQQWQQTYALDRALQRGTIFPDLDLPFVMGRCR